MTPVHDGYALQKSILRHEIGGQTISRDLQDWLTNSQHVAIQPRYCFRKKFLNVEGQETFSLEKKDYSGVTQSYHQWNQEEIVREMKEDMLYVSETPCD